MCVASKYGLPLKYFSSSFFKFFLAIKGERDDAVCRAKKAAKQIDKLTCQLADARTQIAEVKAQLAEAVEYKVRHF